MSPAATNLASSAKLQDVASEEGSFAPSNPAREIPNEADRNELSLQGVGAMLSLKTFTAYVECDGEKLEEYDVQVKDEVATCWIESKVGKASHNVFCTHNQPL